MADEPEANAPAEAAEPEVTRQRRMIEICAAIVLAFSAVAAAWAGYQSARWGGVQATATADANAARLESSRAAATGGQLQQIDIAMFAEAANAFAAEDEELFEFYVDRFRDEFKPAFEEWLATDPINNPDAPLSPFELPAYTVAELEESQRFAEVAEELSADSREARKRANFYTIMVVLLAAALFFAGISTRFESDRARIALVGVGGVIFIAVVVIVGLLPKSVAL